MLCDGIKENGAVFAKNLTIKYDAAKSAAGIAIGQAIVLDDKRFEALSDAVLADILNRYP